MPAIDTLQKKAPINQKTLPRALALWIICLAGASRAASGDTIGSEHRYTVFPYYKIADGWTGFSYLGYVDNPDKKYESGYLGLGASWQAESWLQIWGGLIGLYTNSQAKADTFELRPFIGPKFFLPNDLGWNIYNFTRYEHRGTRDLDEDTYSGKNRLRSRFGVEIPLTSKAKAWDPKTVYLIADVEPYYTLEAGTIDPVRIRGGLGYVLSERCRVELIYHAEYTRPNGGGLAHTSNILRLNLKIGLEKGLLKRFLNPSAD